MNETFEKLNILSHVFLKTWLSETQLALSVFLRKMLSLDILRSLTFQKWEAFREKKNLALGLVVFIMPQLYYGMYRPKEISFNGSLWIYG